eukprot:scaffold134554_cov14-Tisochrysis_lutea.AAC.1
MDGPGPYKPTCPQILRWQGASDLSAATAVANNPARPRPLTATSSRQSALMLHAFNTSSEQQWFFHPSSAHTAVAGLSQWSSLCGARKVALTTRRCALQPRLDKPQLQHQLQEWGRLQCLPLLL